MSAKSSIQAIFSQQRLLPIVQADSIDEGIKVVEAMRDGGLTVIEVVLRNSQALALATEIKKMFPEVTLGIGTVYNTERLDQALNAGADFIVTPATTPALTRALLDCGKPILPGVSSLSDMAQMIENGISHMKLFPAEIVGGIDLLKAVSPLFSDVKFCPTGGVNANNQTDYLSLPNVFAVGGTWMVPKEAVKAKQWDLITQSCQQALAATR